MKKLLLLALAIGVGVLVKTKSEQLKAGAAKVADDPRVQAAGEKVAPAAAAVKDAVKDKAAAVGTLASERLGRSGGTDWQEMADAQPGEPEPVGEPAGAIEDDDLPWPAPGGDPLTDPLPGPPHDPANPTG